jgi:hypothetical protein
MSEIARIAKVPFAVNFYPKLAKGYSLAIRTRTMRATTIVAHTIHLIN